MTERPPLLRMLITTVLGITLALAGLEHYEDRYRWSVSEQWYALEEGEDDWALRSQTFAPQSFSKLPAAGQQRLLLLGGSNPFGFPERPEGSEASPAHFGMARGLAQGLQGRDWELVNLSVNGGSSEDVLRVLRRVGDLGADRWVVYLGHNEMLTPPAAFPHALWRFALVRHLLAGAPRVERPPGVWGPPSYRQEEGRLALEAQLRHNLREIGALARAREAEVLLVLPVSNLAGLDPSWSRDWAGSAPTLQALQDETAEGLGTLASAHPEVAELHWLLGRQALEEGRYEEALERLGRAADEDGYPCRAGPRQRALQQALANEEGWSLLDAQELLAPRLLTEELFYDNAHLRPAGYLPLGAAIASWVLDEAPAAEELGSPELGADILGAAALRSARFWLRWSRLRPSDDGLRLAQAESWAARAAEQGQGEAAEEITEVIAWLEGAPRSSELEPARIESLRRLHPDLPVALGLQASSDSER